MIYKEEVFFNTKTPSHSNTMIDSYTDTISHLYLMVDVSICTNIELTRYSYSERDYIFMKPVQGYTYAKSLRNYTSIGKSE